MVHFIKFCLYMLLHINFMFYLKSPCDKYVYEDSEEEHLEFLEECNICKEI